MVSHHAKTAYMHSKGEDSIGNDMSFGMLCACRGYAQKKITENVECEIMHVIVQEAMDSYR